MKKNILTFAAILAVLPAAASAAISVDNSATSSDLDTGTATNTISSFTVAAGNKLAVAFSCEIGGGVTASSIQFGGENLVFGGASSTGPRRTEIWYLDVSALTTADLVLTFSGNGRSLFGALSLSGAEVGGPVVANSVASGASSIGLTGVTADTFVLAAYVQNAGAASLSSNIANVVYNDNSGSSWGFMGYQNEAVSGDKTYTWTNGDGDAGIAAVGFAAIPEPGSYALLAGFGGLVLVMVRRRL